MPRADRIQYLLTFANGRDVIASVIAHEIGHNLGLNHTTSGGANLMSPQGTSEQLTESQINTALTATSFARPLPIGAKVDVGAYEFGAVPLAGDFNQDGTVDATDYSVWRDGLGSIYTMADYATWKSHFRQSLGSSSGAIGSGIVGASAVPEPAAVVLLLVGMLVLSTRFVTIVGRSRDCR